MPAAPARRSPIAFLIHPRTAIASDLAGLFGAPLALVPDGVYHWALERVPVPPLVSGSFRYADAPDDVAGWIITVPLGPRGLLRPERTFARARIDAAVDRACRLGAQVVGLGALTAPATGGGRTLARRADIGVTNGNAFTAAMTLLGVERLLDRCPADPVIAVVGASGSVGRCLTYLLARRGLGRLLLVARNGMRLAALAQECRHGTPIETSTDMGDLRRADLVVLLTSAADAVLRAEHLKRGAVVLDDTQPRNTDPAILRDRPDVTVVDGGVVEVPAFRLRGNIGLPPTLVYACLAETMLLGLDGHRGHFSIGAPMVEQADHMLALARRHAQLGFRLAPFLSFGKPLSTDPTSSPHIRGARPARRDLGGVTSAA